MEVNTLALAGLWGIWETYSKPIKETVFKALSDATSKKAKDAVMAAWERVDWHRAAAKYRDKIQEMYGSIRILGKPEPVSLEGIFTDVLILETLTAIHRYDINLLRNEPEELERKPIRKSGLALVKNSLNRRIFILGKPGAGKTTFSKYLAIQAAQGNIEKIPMFISLKEWSDSELELMDFLELQFNICDFPDAKPFVEHVLEKGDALVLFDGLDEVNQEGNHRAKMIRDLRDFSNKYWKAQCLVTCRIAATEYAFDNFVYVELADFTDKQVATFVRKWFKGSRKKRQLFEAAFNRAENKRLQELARVPLLLSLLCLSFDSTLEFPQRRVEIYEEALEALLKKWDTSRSIKRDEIYHGLSLGRKRQMFARIAAKSFQEGKYFFSQNDLTKQIIRYLQQLPGAEDGEEIDGDTILKAIEAQHGIFTERAHRIYSFSHLTFQEYFTAKQIVADTTGRALKGLLTLENITDDRWREVILLTVSLLDNADDFFDIFLNSIRQLIAEEPFLSNLLNWVYERTENLPSSAAIKAYFCYLIFNLLVAPSFSKEKDGNSLSTSTISFNRDYSSSQIIEICFSLAQKLDRSHVLSDVIPQDTLVSINDAYKALHKGNADNISQIPDEFLNANSALVSHLIQTFFSSLSITNLMESVDTTRLVTALRRYFVELRKYAIDSSQHFSFGASARIFAAEELLAVKARELVVPPETAPSYAWAKLVEHLHSIIQKYAITIDLLSVQRTRAIARFFVALQLMVDCLSLAVVSNRAAIEDRMFRLTA